MNETHNALVLKPAAGSLGVARPPAERLLAAFLAGRAATTLRAYAQDLEDFRLFVGAGTTQAAAETLLAHGPGEANAVGLAYRADLLERKLAPSTVNRRLAALRSLVALGRTLGLTTWGLDVPSCKTAPYRDTRGPGRTGYLRLLEELDIRLDAKARRDAAIVHLLFDLALRRAEVVSLDLEDVDLEAGTVAVLGKGRREKARLTLPEPTKQALARWLQARGAEAGPLFHNFDRCRGKRKRLTGTGLYKIVRDLGLKVGLKLRPHGLRHAAITEALDLTNGNVRAVQQFSRHRDLRTLNLYDDNRTDLAGDVAQRVAAGA